MGRMHSPHATQRHAQSGTLIFAPLFLQIKKKCLPLYQDKPTIGMLNPCFVTILLPACSFKWAFPLIFNNLTIVITLL